MSNLTENERDANKEILEKIREAKNDEGVEFAINKGIKLGNSYSQAVGFLLFLISHFAGLSLVVAALFTLSCAHTFGDFMAKYKYFKQRRYLAGAIGFGVLMGGFFAFQFVREVGILQGWWG